ncbi:DUF5518 domain-containing protein [Haloplanus salilacus]|uniref:DUF5518 domain-containing protein n=1 Tax=Haloplanus salilacus TaxID=2949994 RepID=UPI0030CF4BB1
MVRIGPLQTTVMWKYALVGGVLALPFTALEAWRSPEDMTLGMVVVGSVVAGYLVKRRGGKSTATGLRAGLVGGFPALWGLHELLWAVPTVPNPLWFRIVGGVMVLSVGGVMLVALAVFGSIAGRFGGWVAERRGHGGAVDATGSDR